MGHIYTRGQYQGSVAYNAQVWNEAVELEPEVLGLLIIKIQDEELDNVYLPRPPKGGFGFEGAVDNSLDNCVRGEYNGVKVEN